MQNLNPLSFANIQTYVDGAGVYRWNLCTSPALTLVLDIPRASIEISGNLKGGLPDADRMARCRVSQTILKSGEETFHLTISDVQDWFAYYGFVELVAKQMTSGREFAVAFSEAFEIWTALVSLRPSLSEEQEVGLFGELSFLEYLVGSTSNFDIDSWAGPDREEHDFKFSDFDLEIKSTRGERRSHQISSLTQLQNSPGRLLYFLSMQFTRAGVGGQTLPDLVARIESILTPQFHGKFWGKLEKVRYRKADSDLYKTKWSPRSTPQIYPVDLDFPALLPTSLDVSSKIMPLISEVRYRIDVTGLTPTKEIFAAFTSEKEENA